MKTFPWFGLMAAVTVTTGSAVFIVSGGSAATSATAPASLVEDYTHPGTEQILADHDLKVFKGDGHIEFTDSRTLEQGQCPTGEIQVEKQTDVEPYGVYFCFKTRGTRGFLTLEVPGTFGIRGGNTPVEATATLPDGTRETYEIPAHRPVAISPGSDAEPPRAVLVELQMGSPDAAAGWPAPADDVSDSIPTPEGDLPFTAHLAIAGPRSCSAALIDPSWIITAKACFQDSSNTTVLAGPPHLQTTATVGRTNLSGTNGHRLAVHELVPHPDRDLVLARLSDPVRNVPTVRIASTAPQVGDVVTIAGYGRTSNEWIPDRLHHAQSTIDTVEPGTLQISGKAPANASPCKGDAGGPTLRQTPSGMELIAVHHSSHQAGCIRETATRNSATESRVDDLANWLRQTTSSTRDALWTGQEVKWDQLVLQSPNGRFALWLQNDGNLVLYRNSDRKALWASYTTNATRFANQTDGNLVLYRADGTPVWHTHTYNAGPATVYLQDDGNLVLYRNSDRKVLWATYTYTT